MTNLPTNYVPWNPQVQAEDDDAHAMSSSYAKLKPGINLIRVLPGHPNMQGRAWVTAYRHYVPDIGDGTGGSVICPARQDARNRRPCPICDMLASLSSSGSADPQELRRRRASPQYVMNVYMLDYTPGKPGEPPRYVARTAYPQELSMSYTLKNLIWDSKHNTGIAVIDKLNPEAGVIPFPDPVQGRNLLIEKKEGPPWWSVGFHPNAPLPLTDIEGIEDDWYAQLKDLTAVTVVLPDERLRHIAGLLMNSLMTPRGASPQAMQRYVAGPPLGGGQPALTQQPTTVTVQVHDTQQAQAQAQVTVPQGGLPTGNAFSKL